MKKKRKSIIEKLRRIKKAFKEYKQELKSLSDELDFMCGDDWEEDWEEEFPEAEDILKRVSRIEKQFETRVDKLEEISYEVKEFELHTGEIISLIDSIKNYREQIELELSYLNEYY